MSAKIIAKALQNCKEMLVSTFIKNALFTKKYQFRKEF